MEKKILDFTIKLKRG